MVQTLQVKGFVRFETGEESKRKKRTSQKKLQNRWETNHFREVFIMTVRKVSNIKQSKMFTVRNVIYAHV